MEPKTTILEGHSDMEKGAYLGAIASLATADRTASEEEMQYIEALCDAAALSPQQKEAVERAATELSDEELNHCLDVLKNSDLRFSLITDLMAFAQSDSNYSDAEKQKVEQIAQYLNVNQQQFSLLDQFTQKATEQAATPEEVMQPNFLSDTGLGSKLQNAGINTGSLLRGMLGVVGPLILTGMLNRGMRRGGGPFGRSGGFGGGFGSLINILSGGRSFGNMGGIFGRILRGGF